MTNSYEIKNSANCTIHTRFGSNSTVLLYLQGSYQQGEEKDSDTENDRENGLRMKNEMTMKEKRFSFFCRPARKKSGKPTHIWHIAFCPPHEPTLRKSQRAKSSLRFKY